MDVFRPGSRYSLRKILSLLHELPDDSALVASIRASSPPPAGDSPVAAELRARRAYRGLTVDRELLARIGDALTGKRWPRPYDEGSSTSGRKVLDLDQMP